MNPQVLRRFNQAGQTPAVVKFDGVTPMNWVVDISRPLRGLQVSIRGQLLVGAGGGNDPAPTLDVLLKMLGTMQLTLSRDGGNFDIVPAGTRVDFFYRSVEKITKIMRAQGDAGSTLPQATFQGEPGYYGVTGVSGPATQPFAIKLYIPFQVLGTASHEADRAMFVKAKGDTTLTLTITPSMATTGTYAPFPGSDRVYTFADIDGTGNQGYARLILDQIQEAIPSTGSGAFLPAWETKSLTIDWSNSVIKSGVLIQNWERGGLWHSIFFNEGYVLNSGGIQQGSIISIPGSEGAADSFTLLRDFYIKGNTETLLEENLVELVANQHPYPDTVNYAVNTQDYARTPLAVLALNLMRGKSLAGAYDFSRYASKDIQVNFQFDNLAGNASNTTQLDMMVLRYQPR